LAQTLHLVIPQLWIFPLVSICGVSAALWLSLREKGDALRHLLFVSLPLSLLTAPYVWSHSFLPLLLPYLALISSRLQLQEARTIRAHTAFSLLGVCEVVKPLQLAPLMALLPSSILAFGLQGKRPQLPEKLSLK
jgi:cytochrome bd-type quinol oxidase subunit 2